MSEGHSWTRIPHYLLNLFSHQRFKAMYGTFRAGRFPLLIPAFIKALKSIFLQAVTFLTKRFRVQMMTPAVHLDHSLNYFFLPLYPSKEDHQVYFISPSYIFFPAMYSSPPISLLSFEYSSSFAGPTQVQEVPI